MSDLDGKVREQAFWVLRSLSENEFGVGLVFRELGSNGLLDSLTEGLNSRNEDIVLQVRLFAFGWELPLTMAHRQPTR